MKVHIVYKTHLDIGFTDYSEKIVNLYLEDYIPLAIDTAKKVNTIKTNFVWTTGSWLIKHALETYTGEMLDSFTVAIEKGWIRWHAWPFTTHTELMNEELMEYAISISKTLDEHFGVETVAAKMTDVPGHTKFLAEFLSKNGIEFFHVGVNPASKMPDTPTYFYWGDEKDKVLTVYSQGYGNDLLIENESDILVFAHSDDNVGPPTADEVFANIEKYEEKYPECEIIGSTMDAYYKSLKLENDIKLISGEIGDSWIHGASTDPEKILNYRLILDAVKDNNFPNKEKVLEQLLLVTEHTWGMDTKLFLADYDNYEAEKFNKSYSEDVIPSTSIPDKYNFFTSFSLSDEKIQKYPRKYSIIENSWNEQRLYTTNAYNLLPESLKNTVDAKKNELFLADLDLELTPVKEINFKGVNLVPFFRVIGEKTYDGWRDNYVVNFENTKHWSLPDQCKPGLELANSRLVEDCFVEYDIFSATTEKFELYKLTFKDTVKQVNKPGDLYIKINKNDNKIIYNWEKIGNNRWPVECGIKFETTKIDAVYKINKKIDLNDFVKNAGQNLMCASRVETSDLIFNFKINNLISISENYQPLNINGIPGGNEIYLNLYNNLWGTNFPMWYAGDIFGELILETK